MSKGRDQNQNNNAHLQLLAIVSSAVKMTLETLRLQQQQQQQQQHQQYSKVSTQSSSGQNGGPGVQDCRNGDDNHHDHDRDHANAYRSNETEIPITTLNFEDENNKKDYLLFIPLSSCPRLPNAHEALFLIAATATTTENNNYYNCINNIDNLGGFNGNENSNTINPNSRSHKKISTKLAVNSKSKNKKQRKPFPIRAVIYRKP